MFKRFITQAPINTVPSNKAMLTLTASYVLWFLVYAAGTKVMSSAFEYKYPSTW